MHSPIIYLIENDSDFSRSMKGQLPREDFPEDVYLLDYISDSDWLVPNTLEEHGWHRNQWSDNFIDMFENNPYFKLNQYENGCLELEITKEHLLKWDLDLLDLNKKMTKELEKHQNNNTIAPRFAFDNFRDYMAYKDMLGYSFGGEKFVVYKSFEDKLELYDVFSLSDLIESVKFNFKEKESKGISYQVCLNIVGDYHF